ncbi:MAG: V-type ATPase 116kDa subunit family protein [Conexivisphaerales archaeon]
MLVDIERKASVSILGNQSLVKVVVVAPKSDAEKVFREMARFNSFSVVEDDAYRQRYELAEEIKKLRDQLGILAGSLLLKEEPGVIEVLTKGYHIKKEKFEADGWEDYVAKVKAEADPILAAASQLNEDISAVRRRIEELESQRSILEFVSTFHGDVGAVSRISRFYAQIAIAKTSDIKELTKSLPMTSFFSQVVSKRDSVILVFGEKGDGQRIERVLKSFETRPISLPRELSQDPIKAYQATLKEIDSLQKRRVELEGEFERFKEEKGERILYLKEASQIACGVLSHASSNPFSRFIKIEGYIPSSRVEEFRSSLKGYMVIVEETAHKGPAEGKAIPTLMKNPKPVDSFEAVTLTQGSPSYTEIDPTFIISLVFPIFYGIMFADAGQGILMLLLGLTLWFRGTGSIKKWGFAITTFGAAATVVGLLVGEVFGFELHEVPGIGPLLSHIVIEKLRDPVTGMPTTQIILGLMVFSIIVGIFHISAGLILDIAKSCRRGEKVEMVIMKIPTLIFYISGVMFALAFVGGGYSFGGLSSSSATPLIGIPVKVTTSIAIPLILLMIVLIAFGRAAASLAGKLHSEESLGIMIIEGIVEVLLKIVEFLANSVSYARLGILLIVHTILMGVVNMAWTSLGVAGLPILIFGNIGVMMLEGLIVYIQDLRLHLYEWFTKFYEGDGTPFKNLLPYARRVEVVWKP